MKFERLYLTAMREVREPRDQSIFTRGVRQTRKFIILSVTQPYFLLVLQGRFLGVTSPLVENAEFSFS